MFEACDRHTKSVMCVYFFINCGWKFCEIWTVLRKLASRWAKFCEISSHNARYGMYVILASVFILKFLLVYHYRHETENPFISNKSIDLDKIFKDPELSDIRQSLLTATEDGDVETLAYWMDRFNEKGMADRGDLTTAKKKLHLAKLNRGRILYLVLLCAAGLVVVCPAIYKWVFQLTMAAYNAMVPRGLYEVVSVTSSDNIEATLYSLPVHNVHNVSLKGNITN